MMQLQLLLLLLLHCCCNQGVVGCQISPSKIEILDTLPAGAIAAEFTVTEGGGVDVAETNSFSTTEIPVRILGNGSIQLISPFTESNTVDVICNNRGRKTLVLVMNDTDNNAPVWSKSNYFVSVREDQAVPFRFQSILTSDNSIRATDADSSTVQELSYSIAPGPYSDRFALENPLSTIMNITMIGSLDYEEVKVVNLTLQITDRSHKSGHVMFVVNSTLTVTVINVDDVNPIWLNCNSTDPCYIRQMLSNSSAGTVLQPAVRAVDGDRDLNISLIYSILTQSPEAKFSINNRSGELTLTSAPLNPVTYTLILFATQSDNPDKKTEAKLQVNVVSTGYNAPVFEQPVLNLTVSESSESEKIMTVLTATAHLGRSVTFGLVNYRSMFRIDGAQLKLTGKLDYETQTHLGVNVSASDGIGTSFSLVNVFVENFNEFSPQFNASSYEFAAARRERNLLLGRVSAYDRDGDAVRFSITDADFQRLFSVDAVLGDVRLNAEGSALPLKTYRFTVTASDVTAEDDTSRSRTISVSVSFDSSLSSASTASVSVIALSVLGSIFALIIIAAIAAYLLYRCRAGNELDDSANSQGSINDTFDYDMVGTSRQQNPIEGYNNYMFGDEDAPDIGPYTGERGQSEMFVSDSIYNNEGHDYPTLTNGSIHTFSGSGSLVGSQRTLISGHPRQLHNDNNLRVVQVENAIDAVDSDAAANSAANTAARTGSSAQVAPGMTVYF